MRCRMSFALAIAFLFLVFPIHSRLREGLGEGLLFKGLGRP